MRKGIEGRIFESREPEKKEPIEDRHAVHSMDHGVVWITYSPDLSEKQIKSLRPYGKENYVVVSPYDAPVTATSWRSNWN